jgi:hypothetical protein
MRRTPTELAASLDRAAEYLAPLRAVLSPPTHPVYVEIRERLDQLEDDAREAASMIRELTT